MRHRLAWLAGLSAAIALAARALRGRRRASPGAVGDDPRAHELRRRLDESRSLVDERDDFEEREVPVDRVDTGAADVDERRRSVHEEGRAAVDEMRRSPQS